MATPQPPPVPVHWTRKGKSVSSAGGSGPVYVAWCATDEEAAWLMARANAHALDCAAIAAGKPHRPSQYSRVLAAQRGAST